MSTRRRLQPLQRLSPLSANIVGVKLDHATPKEDADEANALAAMDKPVQDDTRDSRDTVSLASLENDADDFERLMIQNARDERRFHDTLQGKLQPFRKARTHPRVGVTLENLERHNARNSRAEGANAQVQFESPPSSSGSARSDPAIQPPVGWGRKGRIRRHWMRTITSHDEQAPGAQDAATDRSAEADGVTIHRADSGTEADVLRPSIEDSPLSHKSARSSTPRQKQVDDWDFDFNEASIIASTPYLPQNTALDEIRQREIESLKEQGVTTSRLDQIRESSPEETRRARSLSAKFTYSQHHVAGPEETRQNVGSPELSLGRRTSSWQTTGKSQTINGGASENSPIVVYKKSSETVGVVDLGLTANVHATPHRPSHRREDSQDLLRRLARVSGQTPSPGKSLIPRPQTAPATQPEGSSQAMLVEKSPKPAKSQGQDPAEEPLNMANVQKGRVAIAPHSQQEQQDDVSQELGLAPQPAQESAAQDVQLSPVPVEHSLLNPKTPVVTGAWVDTPRPGTVLWAYKNPQSRSQSPKKRDPRKRSPEKEVVAAELSDSEPIASGSVWPDLPKSALEAVVEEAKANGKRWADDFGDSTINSLEELIAPAAESPEPDEIDEDTLQGLQLPCRTPRNDAERQRQQELLHLHRMNERLRAARTSIRDASRGMKRVEREVEHVEHVEEVEGHDRVRIVYKECPCAANGGHQCAQGSLWKAFKSLFYDERLKPRRRGWGLTLLSVGLIALLGWFVAENAACEVWCHHLYATSYKGFGVTYGAPEFPFVIPTMTYRAFVKPWLRPLWTFSLWCWKTIIGFWFASGLSEGTDRAATRASATRVVNRIIESGSVWEGEESTVLEMGADEIVR